MVIAVVLGILSGGLIGLINGLNVAVLGLPPFIATLAMMMVAQGLALVISGVAPIYFNDVPGFQSIALGTLIDRKSTRLNSSHVAISYAVFCLKTKQAGKSRRSSRFSLQCASRGGREGEALGLQCQGRHEENRWSGRTAARARVAHSVADHRDP